MLITNRVLFTNNFILIILLLSTLFLLSIQFSYAGNHTSNRSLLHNNAELLGWISISCGLIANIPFILYGRVKRLSVKRLGGGDSLTRNLALEHTPIINFHTVLNLIGFFTGMFHGILLVRGIDFISMSLAIVITTLTVSGILIRFTKLRIVNQFNRIIHTHIILSTLVVILVILHLSFS
jgi:hypothetical protein